MTANETIENQLKNIEILLRVNNVLLSKFILQLQTVKKELHLPKLKSYFKFELLEEEYVELISKYNRNDVDKALFKLDRMLVNNQMDCPNNIKRYITSKLNKKEKGRKLREEYAKKKDGSTSEEETTE